MYSKQKPIDLVISGMDLSGTSTQVGNLMSHLSSHHQLRVKDLRGSEADALFHCKNFEFLNFDYASSSDFIADKDASLTNIVFYITSTFSLMQDLRVASMVDNETTEFIDPNNSDVWVMEEPTKRGAGQVNRVIEQNRSQFGFELDPISAAHCHQAYRSEDFMRFRKPIRDNGLILIRSRSEESACYQVFDERHLPNGINVGDYLNLPGHRFAFGHPPTHLFIVCGSPDMTSEQYFDLMRQRKGNRGQLDDHEKDVSYQLLVNRRYATDWLEEIYSLGCEQYGNAKTPEIHRFSIELSLEETKFEMNRVLDDILRTRND